MDLLSNRSIPSLRPYMLLGMAVATFLIIAYFHGRSPDTPLGVFYVLPMLPAALVLNRWQVVLFGLVLALVRSAFVATDSVSEALLRFLLALLAYWATGLFVVELVRNRSLSVKHGEEMAHQERLRMEAEAHLRMLADSSPAAIVTLDDQARILSGNQAAAMLLGIAAEELKGFSIGSCLPVLADALRFSPGSATFRTAAQCQGKRCDGTPFVAQTWFSTYDTPLGRRLAAIAVDISDEIRDREEQNLRQLLANNRIVAAAVSHEIRNVCGAIALVHSRILQHLPNAPVEDFQTLGSLVGALGKIAAMDLTNRSRENIGNIDLRETLDQLRVIIEPDWREVGGEVQWLVPQVLPRVSGESYGILQVLMNLSQNSLRAVAGSPERILRVESLLRDGKVQLCVTDSGCGIADPASLFAPFQSGAGQGGLGLYVSRAILRSYGGDLRCEPSSAGARFVIELFVAAGREVAA